MGYYDFYLKYKNLSFGQAFGSVSSADVERALEGRGRDEDRFLALLSPAAEEHLEAMARKAHRLTLNNFGKTIQLYTPLYLSNFCENQCAYCGFNSQNDIPRQKLDPAEVEKEAAFISATGLEHVLLLTGESRLKSPPSYIRECLGILRKYFSSISIEIYPLTEEEYAGMVKKGVDGLTIYQETYDEKVYDRVHKAGPKKNYLFRLDAPERAAKNGIRNVSIGVLLGLSGWRRDVFFLGLHAKYLQDKFPDVEIGASVPRLRPHAGNFEAADTVSDKNVVQIITALRILLPRLGINLSTREAADLRDNLLPLGITRLSAGSSTRVGGHTAKIPVESNLPQFEISDCRNVEDIKAMLTAKGYQPVLKDWLRI